MQIPQVRSHTIPLGHAFVLLLPRIQHLSQYVHQRVCKSQFLYLTENPLQADLRMIAIQADPTVF